MIYMDNAATTRVKAEVLQAMLPFFCEDYGNPSSVHAPGRAARKACEAARRQAASYLGVQAREIYFTSCGSESDTWAVLGSAYAPGNTRRTLVTTQIEHKAVLNAAKNLERNGLSVRYVPVDAQGMVDMRALENAVDKDTFLVSVMAANNETGCIQDIARAAQIAHDAGALFHTDAVQAAHSCHGILNTQSIDMLTLSAHKLHGPKGCGILYIKEGVELGSTVFGGSQERGRRGGTENLPSIVGAGKALELLGTDDRSEYVAALRARLENGILGSIPGTHINGQPDARVSGISNITFDGVDGEALLLNLDLKHICVSAGSACTSGSVDPSHVLIAMGKTREQAQSSVRFSLSDENTAQEVDTVIETLIEITHRLRKMSNSYGR